ncbi:cadherin-related family member 5-like isoform X8 [Narcine bancroftii]|uniref:cadherin-related family member 5-like isoform X8 n=1 Tax=Narcine bancroftii TaxID=1343680 RepID=UPI0038313FD4
MGSLPTLCGLLLVWAGVFPTARPQEAVPSKCSAFNECCVPDTHIRVKENNKPGDIISLITITTPPISIAGENVAGRVIVVGNSLQLTQSLDFEEMEEPLIFVSLLCGPNKNSLALIIEVINVNDNQPEFPEKVLSLNISELYPVGQAWMMVKAIDLDQDLIYYNMDSSTDGANFFRLKTENTPELYLTHRLDFATKPQLTLVLNAKEAENSTSVSDTVNITVCVVDEDNLLPVFLPCTIVLGNGVCLNAVYHGRITQYTLEVGPLSLQPQEICAVDGDTGINATISYQIISGDHSNGFQIDKAKGTLTMRKAATSINPIVLTVLASQVDDPYKYTVTSVTLTVLRVNKHPLNFSNTDFHGVVAKGSPSGSIILCRDFPSLPLIVQAQDGDYPNMTNPRLTYSLTPGHFFSISRDGILLTKTTLSASPSEYNLMVTATDDEHAETASARVTVVVMATDGLSTQRPEVTGPPGTSPSSGTLTSPALTPGKATTTRKPVSNPAGSMTTHPGSSSGSPNSPGPLISTTGAAPGSRPTPPQPTISGTTAMPEVGSSRPGATLSSVPETTAGPSSLSLVYSARHMAAVGVPLSVLLLVCLVIITILVRDVGWKNIKQRSAAKLKVFSRRPGSSGVGSLQFTNKVLLEEGEVKGSLNFLQPPVESSAVGTALALESVLGSGEKSSETMGLAQVGDKPQVVNNEYSMLQDNTSDIEVKSILTKERRNGEGYKAVWFQQDIEQQVMGDTLDEEDAGEGIDGDHNDRSGFSSSL